MSLHSFIIIFLYAIYSIMKGQVSDFCGRDWHKPGRLLGTWLGSQWFVM